MQNQLPNGIIKSGIHALPRLSIHLVEPIITILAIHLLEIDLDCLSVGMSKLLAVMTHMHASERDGPAELSV